MDGEDFRGPNEDIPMKKVTTIKTAEKKAEPYVKPSEEYKYKNPFNKDNDDRIIFYEQGRSDMKTQFNERFSEYIKENGLKEEEIDQSELPDDIRKYYDLANSKDNKFNGKITSYNVPLMSTLKCNMAVTFHKYFTDIILKMYIYL